MIIAVFLAMFLDPIRFIFALIVVLFSRKKWIILLAAAISAVLAETVLYSIQYTYTWGQGLPVGFPVSLVHASIVFGVRSWLGNRKKTQTKTPVD